MRTSRKYHIKVHVFEPRRLEQNHVDTIKDVDTLNRQDEYM